MPFDQHTGEWYDDPYWDNQPDPQGRQSPLESAYANGGQEGLDAAQKAADTYYNDPGVDTAGHDPVNWYDPSTYGYLLNTPGATGTAPAPGAKPDPTPKPTNTLGGLSPWTGSFNPSPFKVNLPTLAEFKAPALPTIDPFKAPDAFAAPSGDAVLKDPSYGLRKSAGEQALVNSQAAQGLVRSGGSLKDLVDYNQNFASTEYKSIYDRAASEYDRTYQQLLDEFQLNTKTKFDTYDRDFQGASTAYGGDMTRYTTEAAAAEANATAQAKAELDKYNADYNTWKANQDEIMWMADYQKSLAA